MFSLNAQLAGNVCSRFWWTINITYISFFYKNMSTISILKKYNQRVVQKCFAQRGVHLSWITYLFVLPVRNELIFWIQNLLRKVVILQQPVYDEPGDILKFKLNVLRLYMISKNILECKRKRFHSIMRKTFVMRASQLELWKHPRNWLKLTTFYLLLTESHIKKAFDLHVFFLINLNNYHFAVMHYKLVIYI